MRQLSGIGVLDKAVAVLHAVAEQPCTINDLCQRTGMSRPTAYRIAAGLELHRLVVRDGEGSWRPGPALPELAANARDSLVDTAASVLPRLSEATGESIQLYRLDGTNRICVATAEPPTGLRDTVPVGARLPMTAGSGAKILLAWADPHVQAMYLPDALFGERALSDVRKRGWAHSVGERATGVASISAPVRDSTDTVIAAISVSGPTDRIARRTPARWAADLLAAADALHKRL